MADIIPASDWASRARSLGPKPIHQAITEMAAYQARSSLRTFCRRAWTQLLPMPAVWNWHMDAICEHLAYVTLGEIRFLMISVPPRHSKPCWEEELVVERDRGTVPLRTIRAGDHILTHLGRFRKVSEVHQQGIIPTVQISTKRGRKIIAAPDHPFLTPNGWKLAGELKPQDILAVVRPQECSGVRGSLEEARLLGYLIGDGSLIYSPGFTNSDISTLDDFDVCAKSVGFRTSRKRRRNTYHVSMIGGRTGVSWKNGDVGPVRQWLQKHGLDRSSSYTKRVPASIFGADEETIANFIGAYWACDGYIAKRGYRRNDVQIGCDSVSEGLIRDMQRLLARLGICSTVRRKSNSLRTKKQPDGYVSWALSISDTDAAARFGKLIPIVHEKAARLVYRRTTMDRLYDEDPVVLVESHLALPCRCLTVEDDSSFTVQDVAVHNTMIASVLWPAWHWLHKPGEQFLTASVDATLALQSAILSRRLIESPWFNMQFGTEEIRIFDDENQVGMYRNTKGGYRMAVSVKGRVTGVGGTIQIGDDFHDAKQVESDAIRTGTLAWHDNAWRSRLNDPEHAQKVYIGQRTHDNDVYGHVLEQEGKRWCHLILPMEFDTKKRCITYRNLGDGPLKDQGEIFSDPREKEREILDPKRFSAKTAAHEKSIMSERAWQAQYNQEPVGTGGLILLRKWWRPWVQDAWRPDRGKERPLPVFSEIIQVYDTAFEDDEEADFTVRTTWGMFQHTEMHMDEKLGRPVQGQTRSCAMLIEFMMDKLQFPALREDAIKSNNDFEPDWILIEKKASGHSLIQELKRKGLPVKAVKLGGSSGRGHGSGDLVARANIASLYLEKGCVFYPPRPWAYQLIESASKFPNGPPGSRDIVSSITMAWMYCRRYLDLDLPDDEKDEISPYAWQKKKIKRYA